MKTDSEEGTVSSVEDKAKAGRVLVDLPSMEGTTYPEWIEPVLPAGLVTIPEVGETVRVEAPEGEQLVESPDELRYSGRVLNDANPVHEAFRENYPHMHGLHTPGGHLIVLDDKDGSVLIKNKNGDQLKLKASGEVELSAALRVKLSVNLTELSTGPLEPAIKATTFNTANGVMLGLLTTALSNLAAAMGALGGEMALAQPTRDACNAANGSCGTAAIGIGTFLGLIMTWTSTKVQTG